MKLLQRELGPMHISCDIGCHLFSILPPFNLGNTTMGYGLGAAGASAFSGGENGKRAIAVMGDGGFWHNGLTSRRRQRGIQSDRQRAGDRRQRLFGGHGRAGHSFVARHQPLEKHQTRNCRGREGRRCQMAARHRPHLRSHPDARPLKEAMTTPEKGPKVIIAASECMLNRQRRERPEQQRDRGRQARGARTLRSGCRHLHRRSLLHSPVGLSRRSPSGRIRIRCGKIPWRTSTTPASAAGCAARLLMRRFFVPSFYRAELLFNPTRWDRWSPPCAARSSALCNDWRTAAAPRCRSRSDRARRHSPSPSRLSAGRAVGCSPTGSSTSRSVMAGWCRRLRFRAWRSAPVRRSTTWRCVPRAGRGPEPVFALMPVPGDVDVVIAAELDGSGAGGCAGLG